MAEKKRNTRQSFQTENRQGDLASGQSPPSSSAQTNTLDKFKAFRIEFGPSRKDILNFTNQLAVMVRAGISLQDSLESIAEQVDNAKFRSIIMDLKVRIESGQSFSQALAEHPHTFSDIYINMIAAAEISGSLSDMMQKLAEYLDSEAETRSSLRESLPGRNNIFPSRPRL